MEELLIEHWGQPSSVSDVKTLEESETIGLAPGLYIEGVFLQANVVNRNKRLYPKSVLEKAINQYNNEQVKSKQALGEGNHPSRAMPDPMLAVIIIEKLWWEGDNVLGRARIIEGDYGPGDKLAANIRAGWVPGVSSRGLGSVVASGKGYNIVQPGFKLTVGVDVVWGPSAPDAYVKATEITEQTKTIELKPENKISNAFVQLTNRLKNQV